MEDRFLTEEAYRGFGLSKRDGDELSRWIIARVGYVSGADGRGGSGVFVKTVRDEFALLTARHVVVGCLETGLVSIGVNTDGQVALCPAERVVVSTVSDAALLLEIGRASCRERVWIS